MSQNGNGTNNAFSSFFGQYRRLLTQEMFHGAAKLAKREVKDEDVNDRPCTELVREAMQKAIEARNLKEAALIASDFRDFVTDEQREQLEELVPKVG